MHHRVQLISEKFEFVFGYFRLTQRQYFFYEKPPWIYQPNYLNKAFKGSVEIEADEKKQWRQF